MSLNMSRQIGPSGSTWNCIQATSGIASKTPHPVLMPRHSLAEFPRLVPGLRSQKLQPSGAIGFFCERLENARHARALHTILFAKNAALEIAATWKRAPGDVLELACGHTGATEISANRGMLLPLFQGQGPRNLRQDVRDAEICVALVGHVLHEIPNPLQR